MNINDLHGEELFSYLRKNKKDLIATKRSSLKECDATVSSVTIVEIPRRESTTKSESSLEDPTPTESNTLKVKIVANTANIIDSHMDMILPGAYKESIASRGTSIPHLLDHNQSAIGHIGDVTKVYTETISLKDLGYDANGTTTALVMDSTVRKDYNDKAYAFYQSGKINQHSIGLSYGQLDLAINSSHESDKAEKAIWDKYYPQVINKDIADKRGYFYVLSTVDVRENSAVLFGSNPLTPTLSTKSLLKEEPTVITQPIGNTMTLEEAQGKIITLSEELATAKASLTVGKLEATKAEKDRVINILKAQVTFGTDAKLQKAAMSFIEKGTDLDVAISAFEVIKEATQDASHVDTSGTQGATQTAGDVKVPASTTVKTFDEEILEGLKSAQEKTQLFSGVR